MEVKNHYAVLGDIGGTNFRLRLVDIKSRKIVREVTYMTKDYKSFADYIDRLLEQSHVSDVKHIILAIRGVVVGGECLTDFPGESEKLLREHYKGVPEVRFMNDVEGMAQGILY